MNSKLLDWYFRLGSTNSKVNEYQFNILPCPVFMETVKTGEQSLQENILVALEAEDFGLAYELVKPLLSAPPFNIAVQNTIIEAVNHITLIEGARGDIPRTARSALALAAQPYQDLIDRLIYAMAGLTTQEAADLEERLAQML